MSYAHMMLIKNIVPNWWKYWESIFFIFMNQCLKVRLRHHNLTNWKQISIKWYPKKTLSYFSTPIMINRYINLAWERSIKTQISSYNFDYLVIFYIFWCNIVTVILWWSKKKPFLCWMFTIRDKKSRWPHYYLLFLLRINARSLQPPQLRLLFPIIYCSY